MLRPSLSDPPGKVSLPGHGEGAHLTANLTHVEGELMVGRHTRRGQNQGGGGWHGGEDLTQLLHFRSLLACAFVALVQVLDDDQPFRLEETCCQAGFGQCCEWRISPVQRED